MFEDRVQFPAGFLEGFCRRHHIRRLSFFGSVLRPDFRQDSDIDILVEFEPGKSPGYFRLFEMQEELSRMVGRTVDFRTVGEISPNSIQRIISEARTAYVAR